MEAKRIERERVILVLNPRSSKAKLVEKEVVEPMRKNAKIMLGRYEVQRTSVDENAERLAKILQDGDVVMVAGGDGTAAVAFNGAMLSGKKLKYWALPYGNFNDTARGLKFAEHGQKIYPMEVLVNGEHFRYAINYLTVGLLAESTEIFDGQKLRKKLQKGGRSLIYSLRKLFVWYVKNRKKKFLPEFTLNGEKKQASDYLAVNGRTVARLMKGGDWYLQREKFWSGTAKLNQWWRILLFMLKSMIKRVPGIESNEDVLRFELPATIEVQAEGEYRKLTGVKELRVRKIASEIKVW